MRNPSHKKWSRKQKVDAKESLVPGVLQSQMCAIPSRDGPVPSGQCVHALVQLDIYNHEVHCELLHGKEGKFVRMRDA